MIRSVLVDLEVLTVLTVVEVIAELALDVRLWRISMSFCVTSFSEVGDVGEYGVGGLLISRSTMRACLFVKELWNISMFAWEIVNPKDMKVVFAEAAEPIDGQIFLKPPEVSLGSASKSGLGVTRKLSRIQSMRRRALKRG